MFQFQSKLVMIHFKSYKQSVKTTGYLFPRNNADVTHCEKPCSVFKAKWSNKLKTGQQIFV